MGHASLFEMRPSKIQKKKNTVEKKTFEFIQTYYAPYIISKPSTDIHSWW